MAATLCLALDEDSGKKATPAPSRGDVGILQPAPKLPWFPMGPIPRARLPRAGHGAAAFQKGLAGASRLKPRGETGAEGSPQEAGNCSRLSESLPINFAVNCSSEKTKAAINRKVWFAR